MANSNADAAVSSALPLHAVTRDHAEQTKKQPNITDYVRHAQNMSGRRPFELVKEYCGLFMGRGKLSVEEYVQYGVYDNARYSPEDQARFITNRLHWPITHVCCDMTWQASTEDKWLCSHILERSNVPIPSTLAVVDKSDRAYPGTHKISNAEQLKEFFQTKENLPAFGKETRGMCSLGAFLVTDANDDAVHLEGEGWIEYEKLIDEFIAGTPYLFQRVEKNHSFYDQFTNHLATVRLCILVSKDGIKIPFAVQKLPSRENVADSFWRPGNVACKLDVKTGEVLTVRSKDALGTTDHDTHPDTNAKLLGQTVPMWDQVLELANNCAPIFAPVRYQSMDVAITENGPVLIEINTGGGFDLPQLATGEGFLTDEVTEFFKECGYDKI